jgi:RNA polymerase sigma-70 factor (ECF subfamily)
LADHEIITDENLLRRAAQGEEAAFVRLYERHRDAVHRFAYRLTGRQDAAQDVTHECFMSLLRRPEAFDASRAALRTYLLAAARNLAFKQLRRQGQEIANEEIIDEIAAPESLNPLRRLLKAELASEVRRAVLELPPLQREAVILFEYEDLSLAEIAAVTGVDANAVKARLHRARQKLKHSLAGYWQGVAAAGS